MFIGSYVILSLIYGYYLDYGQSHFGGVDPITQKVAAQSEMLLIEWGYPAKVITEKGYPGMLMYMKEDLVGQIVEGCNSISIIILFIAFILAFRQGWKKTSTFMLAGAVLIYAFNLLRIAVLVIALAKYPEYQDFLHRIVFPGIIYGMVFILWLFWIRTLPKPMVS